MPTEFNGTSAGPAKPAQQSIRESVICGKYVLAAALTLNDTINICNIPANTWITGFLIQVPDVDSATALLLDVQLKAATTKYVTGASIGQTGGLIAWPSPVVAASNGTIGVGAGLIAAADVLQMLVATAPGGGVATGTIRWSVRYTNDVQGL